MTTEELILFANENGFKQISPNGIAGIWDDFVVLATADNQGNIGITISSTAQAGDKKVISAVNKLIKSYGVIVGGWNEKRVFFLLKKKDLLKRTLADFLDIFTRCLRSAKVYPALGCSVCGKQGSDVMAIHGDEYARAHENCIRGEIKRLEIEYTEDKKEKKSNYMPGITGALIGMLIGILANVFLVWLAQGTPNVLPFMLVPLFSYMMYRKYAGETSRITIVSSALASVYGAYFILCFGKSIGMWMRNESGFIDAVNSTLAALFSAGGFVTATKECLIYFAATVFTLYFADLFLKKGRKPAVNPQDVISTMAKI